MKSAKQQILEKVIEIKKTIPGGEKFFDELDKHLAENITKQMLNELFSFIPDSHFLVLSGSFGKMIASKIDDGTLKEIPYYLYNGGIRKGERPVMIKRRLFMDKNYSRGIFLDDSIYGGATYNTLKTLFNGNYSLNKCAVIYDGCPIKKSDIKSVFRYYDHFKATPNHTF